MATVKVVDSKSVMTRMGLQDYDGVAETIASAIKTAEARFQGILDTAFDEVTQTDIFFIEEGKFPVVQDGLYRLRLKRGFIHPSGVTPMVMFSSEIGGDLTELQQPEYIINREKGIVYVKEKYGGLYVTVTYLAGFSDTNPPPSWLKEAMLAYMPYVLNNQQSTNRSDEQGTVMKKVADLSGMMLAPYLRGTAWHYRPIV